MNFQFVDHAIAGAYGQLPTVSPRATTDFEAIPSDSLLTDDLVEVHEETVAPRPIAAVAPARQSRATVRTPTDPANSEDSPVARKEPGESQPAAEPAESDPIAVGQEARPTLQAEPEVTPSRRSMVESVEELRPAPLNLDPPVIEAPTLAVANLAPPALTPFIETHEVVREAEPLVSTQIQTLIEEVVVPREVRTVQERLREVTRILPAPSVEASTEAPAGRVEIAEDVIVSPKPERAIRPSRAPVFPAFLDRIIQVDAPTPPAAPTVDVQIGKIEIHAAPPKQTPRPIPPKASPRRASLSDFMDKRSGDR